MNIKNIGMLGIAAFFLVSCKQGAEVESVEVNEGRDLVMESIDAHGGLDQWYGNGQLKFRWTYHMTDRGPGAVVDTVQVVDVKTLAVKHEVVGKDIEFGVNQGKGWIQPADAEFMPPYRFWALTPYYFLGMPFIFNDENANFELLADTKEFQGKAYQQVKITYNKEAGDSPDDYYVLLIDPETKVTRGAYYIVTSDLLGNPKVGPEKFITLDNLADVSGVKLATGHITYKMKNGVIGEQMRYADVNDVEFLVEGTEDLSVR